MRLGNLQVGGRLILNTEYNTVWKGVIEIVEKVGEVPCKESDYVSTNIRCTCFSNKHLVKGGAPDLTFCHLHMTMEVLS